MLNIDKTDGVCRLTLNDPESLNSLSEAMAGALLPALRNAASDEDVRCVLLTGAGKFFCAGGNLKEFMSVKQPLDEYIDHAMANIYNPLARQLADMPCPVITAINGPAIGAGLGMALNADFSLMARSAWFSMPFVPNLAVVPDFGGTFFLAHCLPHHQAMAVILNGDRISAESAADSKLVYQVVDDEQLAEHASALASKIAALPVDAVRRSKALLLAAANGNFSAQLELEREHQTACFGSDDFAESLAAFGEKRKPVFGQAR